MWYIGDVEAQKWGGKVAVRDRIVWGSVNPFSDPRMVGLDQYVKGIRQGKLPPNVTGGSIFGDKIMDLPVRPHGHYREYDVEVTVPGKDRGKLRIVLGAGGEVYITGNHYRDFVSSSTCRLSSVRSPGPDRRQPPSLLNPNRCWILCSSF